MKERRKKKNEEREKKKRMEVIDRLIERLIRLKVRNKQCLFGKFISEMVLNDIKFPK